jgi:hypothetical protein
VKAEFGKEISMILDSGKRNSLYFMLDRFCYLKNFTLKSLIDLNPGLTLNVSELEMISNIVSTLEPVKLAVETLCRRDATLLSANTTIA